MAHVARERGFVQRLEIEEDLDEEDYDDLDDEFDEGDEDEFRPKKGRRGSGSELLDVSAFGVTRGLDRNAETLGRPHMLAIIRNCALQPLDEIHGGRIAQLLARQGDRRERVAHIAGAGGFV